MSTACNCCSHKYYPFLQKQGLSKMKKGLSMPDLTQAEPETPEEEAWPNSSPRNGARGSEEVARPSFVHVPPPQSSRPPSFNLRQPGISSFSHRPNSPPAPEPSRTNWTHPSQAVSLTLFLAFLGDRIHNIVPSQSMRIINHASDAPLRALE